MKVPFRKDSRYLCHVPLSSQSTFSGMGAVYL
jgi:hypothetical protein